MVLRFARSRLRSWTAVLFEAGRVFFIRDFDFVASLVVVVPHPVWFGICCSILDTRASVA